MKYNNIHVLLFILSIILLCTTQKLELPKDFAIKFIIRGRAPNDNTVYTGILRKKQPLTDSGSWSINAISKQDNYTFFYDTGRMYFVVDDVPQLYRNHKKSVEGCVESSGVPPADDLYEAFRRIKILNQTETFDQDVNKCNGVKWITTYAGEAFILCQEGGVLRKIIGRDVIIEFDFIQNELDSILQTDIASSCEENEYRNKNIRKEDPLPWINDVNTCKYPWLADSKVCDKHKPILFAQEKNYTCIFLHGLGNSEDEKAEPSDSYPGYWGDIHLQTPQCKIRKFIKEETRHRGWNDITLQKSYCDLALFDQPGERVIKNKIIFAHSMGNLILGAAIKNGICDIDDKTTSWYNIQGPIAGSKAVNVLQDICRKANQGFKSWSYQFVARQTGYCKPNADDSYDAYKTLAPGYPGLKEAAQVVNERVSGALCGGSPRGLVSRYQLPLVVFSYIIDYGEESDGLVPLSSCTFGFEDKFKSDYNSKFYLSFINHADGTFRNGDGYWGVDRKPLSWLSRCIGK
jgi:hypothetical protein